MLTFQSIYQRYSAKEENDCFIFYGLEPLKQVFAYNFFALKFNPVSAQEMELLEDHFAYYADTFALSYYTFRFPLNQALHLDILAYLSQTGYQTGQKELWAIWPEDFLSSPLDGINVESRLLQADDFPAYLALQTALNREASLEKDQAREKEAYYRYAFDQDSIQIYGLFTDTDLVASMDLLDSPSALEIDNLSVHPAYRQKGLGSALQRLAMDLAEKQNKQAVVQVDPEQGPRAMYQQQGYRLQCREIYATKVIEEVLLD